MVNFENSDTNLILIMKLFETNFRVSNFWNQLENLVLRWYQHQNISTPKFVDILGKMFYCFLNIRFNKIYIFGPLVTNY